MLLCNTKMKIQKEFADKLEIVFRDSDGVYWAFAKDGWYFRPVNEKHKNDPGVRMMCETSRTDFLDNIKKLMTFEKAAARRAQLDKDFGVKE